MSKVGKNRCGCDCKNQTVDSVGTGALGTGVGYNYGCCASLADGGPCRYAVLFECLHTWPLWIDATGYTCGIVVDETAIPKIPVGVLLNSTNGIDLTACAIPSPLAMTFPITELQRECNTSNDQCIWSQKLYRNSLKGIDEITHMATSYLVDALAESETIRFPPYSLASGEIVYHAARYERTNVDPNYGADPAVDGSCAHYEITNSTTLWELNLSASPPSLEWVYDEVLNAMPRFGGAGTDGTGTTSSHRPQYLATAAWDVFGRNTMTLQNPEDWPSLPRNVCVVAVDGGLLDSQCDGGPSFNCACCDPGGDAIFIKLSLTGCGIAVVLEDFGLNRRTDATDLPGVTVPAGACGFFWATTSIGDGVGCTDPGSDLGTTGDDFIWGGSVGIAIWCDGTDWQATTYCYEGREGIWRPQGTTTVGTFDCLCAGPQLDITLPAEMDCCCQCACADDVPDTVYADVAYTCGISRSGTVTLVKDINDVWTSTDIASTPLVDVINIIKFWCENDQWNIFIDFVNADCTYTASLDVTDCTPLSLIWNVLLDVICCDLFGGGSMSVSVYS